MALLELFDVYDLEVKPPPDSFVEEVRAGSYEGIWKHWIDRTPGGADIFNEVAKAVIASGYTLPGYTPY